MDSPLRREQDGPAAPPRSGCASVPPEGPPARAAWSPATVVVAAKDQVSCDLGGEAAVLNLKAGIYYGLNPVGARVWNLLQEPRRVGEIRDALLAEHDVEPERCERDLLALLEELKAADLIELRGEAAS